MKRLIELAVESGRAWQSDETGFVHYHRHRSDDQIHRSIPTYENFLFALALFRTNLSENVLEGKNIIERLLPFQRDDGSFPQYLDQYPKCYDRYHGVKLLPAIHWILKLYGRVLGQELLSQLEHAKEKMIAHAFKMDQEKPASKPVKALLLAVAEGKAPDLGEWSGEILLACQISRTEFNASVGQYMGSPIQKGFEPIPTLYDLFIGYLSGVLPQRCTRPHPILLQGAMIQPTEWRLPNNDDPYALSLSNNLDEPLRLVWTDTDRTHTFVCQGCRASSVEVDGNDLIFTFNEPLESEERSHVREISFFLDYAEGVFKLPATTFNLDEKITFSQGLNISLSFHLEEGEGTFMGHIMRSNRPSQITIKGDNRFNSYDWGIFLRTIHRTTPCKIRVNLNLE